jgi:hypothetical protein
VADKHQLRIGDGVHRVHQATDDLEGDLATMGVCAPSAIVTGVAMRTRWACR